MDEQFFYAVLRISVAQILKASGFDKCKPSTLNTITDIYIKHFELVLNSAKKFGHARSRCTNVLEAPDLVQALLDVQLIKPSTGDSLLDPKDAPNEPETEYNVKSLESFIKWLQFSDNFNLSKRLSEVPSSQLRNLMEKRKIDTSSETDQEKKKRRLRERQEYYNQLKSGENPANAQFGGIADDLEEAEVTENDKLSWLAYLAEKDVKLGHNLQYVNTVLHDMVLPIHNNSKYHPSKDEEDAYSKFLSHAHNNIRNDHILLNIQEADTEEEAKIERVQPSQKLKDALPYNVKYQDSLLNDDLQQYIEYTEKYGFPATPVSVKSPEPMDVDAPNGSGSQEIETEPSSVKISETEAEKPENGEKSELDAEAESKDVAEVLESEAQNSENKEADVQDEHEDQKPSSNEGPSEKKEEESATEDVEPEAKESEDTKETEKAADEPAEPLAEPAAEAVEEEMEIDEENNEKDAT
ncbi:uncharacterized protein CXQ87_005067 [Candidozyma duobushaemuli]|uniref:Bromodomain associated domain-containing protein n=2 Tax=Candidozyma TaxID=3303203 RepID=A0ABX8IEV8_9ASCO|nr:uncharacterized protein CXQ87_005067 [[Candida] duobushaemulonis]PVH14791.1 hypothetical protein CXQ87_005067 [[Candida] duobushaemulonis]QWU90118.1 hypothetical protein CA3LBN_004476 [[Candida] haemuloni]